MRLLSGAIGVLLLLALLTWLLLRGIDTDAPAYAATLRAFDDFALAKASLHRDVLQARAGLLRDYDTLVKAVETTPPFWDTIPIITVMPRSPRPRWREPESVVSSFLVCALRSEHDYVLACKQDG